MISNLRTSHLVTGDKPREQVVVLKIDFEQDDVPRSFVATSPRFAAGAERPLDICFHEALRQIIGDILRALAP